MEFRLPKDKDWFAAYNWMQIPNVEFEQVKENKALNGEKGVTSKSNLKTAGAETAKKVSFGGPIGEKG